MQAALQPIALRMRLVGIAADADDERPADNRMAMALEIRSCPVIDGKRGPPACLRAGTPDPTSPDFPRQQCRGFLVIALLPPLIVAQHS